MKAVILSAGTGTRLGALTHDIPKSMLPVNNRPLLEYILLYLKKNGIFDFCINLHFQPDKIKNYFENGSRWNVRINYSYEEKLRGTAGALAGFPELKSENRFIVIYGDILTAQPLRPLLDLHEQTAGFATLLVHRNSNSNSFLSVESGGRINRFIERPSEETRQKINPSAVYSNSAVQVLSSRALDYILGTDAFDLPKDVYIPNIRNEIISGYPIERPRVAVDSERRYRMACDMVSKGEFDVELE
jgi:mannose-1-phosphate guanylyltransferase